MDKAKVLLQLIVREIMEIEQFLENTNCNDVNSFKANSMLKKSVTMSLINISECIKELPPKFKEANSFVNWTQFKEIRNIAAHKYSAINFTIVWNIIKFDLPDFKMKIEGLVGRDNDK